MERVSIESLGARGEGIAIVNDRKIFVPGTVPGDEVSITLEDETGDRGALVELFAAGPERIEPFCPHYAWCGGCQLQHMAPELYKSFKTGLVENPLRFAGITTKVAPLIDARGEGRRRASLHVRKAGAGYMARRSHALHPIDHCPILVPALRNAPAIASAFYPLFGDCDVSLTACDNGIDVAIRSERKVAIGALAKLAEKFGLARISINGEPLVHLRAPTIRMGKAIVQLPPASFLQATAEAEAVLGDLVLEAIGKSRAIADLFCGLGPFALRLAQKAPVFAADADKPAIAALQKAVRATQGIKAVTAERRDLFREPLTRFELNRFDTVVLDPPRAGAEAQTRELARTKVPTLVYVSCDPRTFARDAGHLVRGGYRLEKMTPVDQFAFSTHVELVGVFRQSA